MNDVLGRFTGAADFYSADLIVKVNGDSPFIAATLIDEMLRKMQTRSLEFITAKSKYTGYPIGVGAEVIGKSALRDLNKKAPTPFRESITGYIFEDDNDLTFEFSIADPSIITEVSDIDLTIDTSYDLDYIRDLWSNLAEIIGDVDLPKLLNTLSKIGS